MFDQTTLFMIFMMLCFAGIASMFYFILRSLDMLIREIHGERSQLIGLLQSMESSVDLLVKSAQISLQRQTAKEKADLAGKATVGVVADSINATEKWEEDIRASQIKKRDMRDREMGIKPLKLHLDDTK